MLQHLGDQLSRALREALGPNASSAQPGAETNDLPEAFLRWEMPKDPTFGDLSNAVSFKLAAKRKQPPAAAENSMSLKARACGASIPPYVAALHVRERWKKAELAFWLALAALFLVLPAHLMFAPLTWRHRTCGSTD
jgi:hypothetical protein